MNTMTPHLICIAVSAMLLPCGAQTLRADDHTHSHTPAPSTLSKALLPGRSADTKRENLPRLPKGVAELKFSEFFLRPVGTRGLELTEKLRSLDGERVRILGYMAQEETPLPGQFLLAPIPVQIHSHDNSLADDLPASTLHVVSPAHRGEAVPFTPQLLLLTGVLEVGNRAETGGRVSIARLTLDPQSKAGKWQPARKGAGPEKGATALMKAPTAGN